MSLSVKCTGIGRAIAVIAYRRPLNKVARVGIAVSIQHVFIDHDVGGQFGVGCCIAVVDKLRKAVEFCGGADEVIAIAIKLRCNDGEGVCCADGHIAGGHGERAVGDSHVVAGVAVESITCTVGVAEGDFVAALAEVVGVGGCPSDGAEVAAHGDAVAEGDEAAGDLRASAVGSAGSVDIVAVGYRSILTAVSAHDGAFIPRITAKGSGDEAVVNGLLLIIITDDAADSAAMRRLRISIRAGDGAADDVTALYDAALTKSTCDAACTVSGKVAVLQVDVFHRTFQASDKAGMIIGPADGVADVLDKIAVAVVGAFERGGFLNADGGVADTLHINVGGLLERLAAGVVARVDVGGEVNEVLGVVDFVVAALRVVRQAVNSVLRSRRRRGSEHHHKQCHGCPRQE